MEGKLSTIPSPSMSMIPEIPKRCADGRRRLGRGQARSRQRATRESNSSVTKMRGSSGPEEEVEGTVSGASAAVRAEPQRRQPAPPLSRSSLYLGLGSELGEVIDWNPIYSFSLRDRPNFFISYLEPSTLSERFSTRFATSARLSDRSALNQTPKYAQRFSVRLGLKRSVLPPLRSIFRLSALKRTLF